EHRRSGGHGHHHRGSHRHSSEARPHTFSEFSSHSEGGIAGGGGGGAGGLSGGEGHGHSFGGHDHGAATAMDATFVWKLSKLGRIGSSRLRFDDDFADRLNYQYTGVLMFLFIGLIGIRQYVVDPLRESHLLTIVYSLDVPLNYSVLDSPRIYTWMGRNRLPPAPDRELLLIGYYQWAPIVMALQAMAFYLPCLIWRLFMAHSGFNVRRILQMACDSNVLLPEHTMKNVRFIARYMEGCIYRQRDYRRRRSTANVGYSPTSYTGLGQMQHLQLHHHHPHPGFASGHHHHHHHHQSPPYASPPHAPPLYTSSPGNVNFTTLSPTTVGGNAPVSPGDRGRGNGDTAHFGTVPRRGRRGTSQSLLDRLRLRFSLQSELSKSKKQPTLSPGEELRGSDEHPMLGSRKPTDSPSFSPSAPTGTSGKYKSSPLSSSTVPGETVIGVGSAGGSSGWGCCGKRHGNYLVVLYFFIKLLYLTNIIGQLFMMEKFVGNNYTFYGLRVLIDLIRGREWFHSGNFPRVTFCDFEAKKLGKNHKYTLQCVLPLNMFLEKIYIFLWFWHCVIGLVTLSSFIMWFYRMGFASRRVKFIRKYLKIMSVLRDTDKAASSKFVENYLRPDGVFLIRLIAINVGDLMAGDLTCELWHIYRHKRLHEIEDQKFLDAAGDFVIPTGPGYPGDASVDVSHTAGGATRRLPKDHAASAPLHIANNVNNNSSNNNDDSIV
ncbi:Innexin unc-9, partial [Clonorchis sinensis]